MKTKNLPLIMGITIPIIMIILVGLSIWLPNMFAKPQHDFIYTNGTGDPYYCESVRYFVKSNKIQSEQIPDSEIPAQNKIYCRVVDATKLFLHDIETNQSQEITVQQAQNYKVDPSMKSPDGFEVVSGTGGNFLFGSVGEYANKYIKGHGATKKLNLNVSTTNYFNFTFLGWVVQ